VITPYNFCFVNVFALAFASFAISTLPDILLFIILDPSGFLGMEAWLRIQILTAPLLIFHSHPHRLLFLAEQMPGGG